MKERTLEERIERQEKLMERQWAYLKKNITWLPKSYIELHQYCSYLDQYCSYLEKTLNDVLFEKSGVGPDNGDDPQQKRSGKLSELHAVEQWREYQENGAKIYSEKPDSNLSSNNNSESLAFANFIAPKLTGNVLDIGCGPLPRPVYLERYPEHLITGLDPLPDTGAHEFDYVEGFAEDLPFADDTFDTVILATSLDHTILPEIAMQEAVRVLKPGGKILLWEGIHYTFDELFEKYEPENPSQLPSDGYHLFRFSARTLAKFLKKHFVFLDVRFIPGSIMLELSPRKKVA